jgi:hypothetical protein
MSSIVGPQSNNEVVNTLGGLTFERKRRITKFPLTPLVQRMAKLDPPPKGLQTAKPGRPAVSMPDLIVEFRVASANPSAIAGVMEHAAPAIAGRAKKFGAGVSPVEDFITSKLDPLVAVNRNPVRRRLDLHHEPLAGPA